jgi:hypothetical protein
MAEWIFVDYIFVQLSCNNYVWQSDFFGPFRQTKLFRLMELSHLILKYEETCLVKKNEIMDVFPWDPFATFNVVVLIHSFVNIGCAFGTTILFLYS